MPHKHKRRDQDESQFNLPPTARAKPLPTAKNAPLSESFASKKSKKRKSKGGYGDDDTPKAFARLMQLKTAGKGLKGLDNGEAPKSKKRKLGQDAPPAENAQAAAAAAEIPKIQPGERLADFAARVDQALPVAGLAAKGKTIMGVRDSRMTKHEKKLRRLQEGWRKDEARIREKEEEERELAEEEAEELEAMLEDKLEDFLPKGKKGKRKRVAGEVADVEGDPWAVLKAKREAPKGLHDVAQEPPQFKKLPTEKFKVKNGARVQISNVPNAAGSLRRREELGETRKSIIESYRKMMEERRG